MKLKRKWSIVFSSFVYVRYVVSRKSNEYKNKIEIVQSAFEKNMISIETQFMTEIGAFEIYRLVSDSIV